MQKNILRHPDYIKLKHRINACETIERLERLRQVVLGTNDIMKGTKWEQDGTDLMNLFLNKEEELNKISV